MLSDVDYGQVDWYLWRPRLAKVATLQETETYWSIDDYEECHEAMDIEIEIQNRIQQAEEQAMPKMPQGKRRR